ncbi:MAG: TonB-dependent receptor [Flavobacteriaceae bacterium]|nr:TonB-dependent receptor [Flavobacteriaceae bacterium]
MKYLITIMLCCSLMAQQSNAVQDTLRVSTVALSSVTVSALRASEDTPMAFTNISEEELNKQNLGKDLPVLLRFLPNVVTTSDAGAGIGYTGIRVRGSDATRVNVTINGIAYNDAESHGTFWVNLSDFASSVSDLQLQRGVGTSTNGAAAFGASLNINTTELSKDAYALLSSSTGSFNTFKNTVKFSTGLSKSGFELSGRLSAITSDGYIDRASSNLKGYFLQGSYSSVNTKIKALTFGGHERTYQAWNGIDQDVLKKNRTYNPAGEQYDEAGVLESYYNNQVDNYNQDHTQLHIEQRLSNSSRLSLALNYTHGYGYYQEFYDLWYDQNVSYGGDTDFGYLKLPTLSINGQSITATENAVRKWLDNDFYAANVLYHYQKGRHNISAGVYYSSYEGLHFGELIWANRADVNPGHRFYENTGKKKDGNIFYKWDVSINEKLHLYADAQLRWVDYKVIGEIAGPERFTVKDEHTFFNPKTGLLYKPNANNQFYISFAKAHKEPNRTDFENGSPVPEALDDLEFGWRYKTADAFLNANIYFMSYKNQLVLTGAIDQVGAPIRANSGDSYRRGIELEGGWNITSNINLQGNLAWSKNRNKDKFFKRDGVLESLGDTKLAYSPSLVASQQLSYSADNWSVSFVSKYVGEQYMGNIDAELSMLDSYFINDIQLQALLFKKINGSSLNLSLHIHNIFDELISSNGYFYTYDDDYTAPNVVTTVEGVGFYPQAGRHFMAGLTLKF